MLNVFQFIYSISQRSWQDFILVQWGLFSNALNRGVFFLLDVIYDTHYSNTELMVEFVCIQYVLLREIRQGNSFAGFFSPKAGILCYKNNTKL